MENEKKHYKLYLRNFNQSCQNNNKLLDRRFVKKENNLCLSFRPEAKKCQGLLQGGGKSKLVKEGFINFKDSIPGFSQNIHFDSQLKNLSKTNVKNINRGIKNNSYFQNNLSNDSNSKNNKNYNKCIQPNIGFTSISNGKCEKNPNLFNNITRRKCQKYNHK